jgi:hypothetical protein
VTTISNEYLTFKKHTGSLSPYSSAAESSSTFQLKKNMQVLLYHQLLKHPPVYWKKGSASINAMKNGFNEMVYLTLYENTLQLKKASSFDCTTNNDCRTF